CTVNPDSVPACALDATGARFAKAGEDFSATVTATQFNGSATPNYGNEISAEGVRLTSNIVLPALGVNPLLTNASVFGSFSSGVATGTTFRWDEVGIITLTPSVADGDYLIAGDVTGTTSGNVGRFYPDHLLLTQGTLTNRSLSVCAPVSTFTYAGEQMQIATFTLTARNGAAAPTVNYNTANSFAKFDGSIIGNFNLGAVDLADAIAPLTATALTGSLNGVSSSGSWVAGVGTFTVNLSLNRAATPDGPYESFSIGTVPTDTDGVQLNSYDVDTDLNASNDRGLIASAGKVRFGRLKLFNAHGSELLGLTIPMQAQYWNGTEFILNGNDSCTAIAAANVTMSAYQPNLTACETAVSASGNFSSGKANLQLTAPGINNNGSVDMTVNLGAIASGTTCAPGPGVAITANRPYLQGNWGGSATYDKNPTGRATFGVYKGRDEFIYLRENY
ncbi:MAG: hypothetical protein Q7S51_03365, partial [Gallionellaceae bacterium]|nr:hypothetical protein [Gallionellaceae bacterium]